MFCFSCAILSPRIRWLQFCAVLAVNSNIPGTEGSTEMSEEEVRMRI